MGAIASLPLVNTKRPARSRDFVTGIAGGDAGGAVASCPCVWAAVEWRRGVVGEPEPHVLPVRELWRLNARNTVWLSELLFVTNHGSTSKRKICMDGLWWRTPLLAGKKRQGTSTIRKAARRPRSDPREREAWVSWPWRSQKIFAVAFFRTAECTGTSKKTCKRRERGPGGSLK